MPCCPRRLLEPVELGAVEQLAEDLRNLGLDDSRAVVLDHHQEAPLALGQLGITLAGFEREVVDLDRQLGKDAGLLAGVEGVVHGFLDRGEQRLGGIVEAQQVAVLREELGDRDLPLALGHGLRGGAPGRGFLSGRNALGLGGWLRDVGDRRRWWRFLRGLVEQVELRSLTPPARLRRHGLLAKSRSLGQSGPSSKNPAV